MPYPLLKAYISVYEYVHMHVLYTGFSGGSVVKNLPANAGDVGSIPGSDRCPGEGNGYPLQYSCLENPMDRVTWQATVHGGHKDSDTTETQLNMSTSTTSS